MSTDGFVARVMRRAYSWLGKRGGFSTVTIVTPTIVQPGQEVQSALPVLDLDSRIVDEDKTLRSDASSGPPLLASRYDNGLWRVAWTDGRLGVDPGPHQELVLAQAELAYQTRIAPVQNALLEAEADENARKSEHEQNEKEWERASAELVDVTDQQRRDPGEFSRLMSAIYFLAAMAIMVADIPLSLIVADALGIHIAVPGDPHDLLNLLRHWNQAWEAGLVALGVASLAVIFKLIIDRLYIRDDKAETWQKHMRSGFRIGSLCIAAAAAIYACYVMGDLRAEQMAVTSASPNQARLRVLYTLLALLFPVVAAYCLSMARLCWQNASRLALAMRARHRASNARLRSVEPYEASRARHFALKARLDAMKSEEIDKRFLRELYTHAYDRGWSVPETRHPNDSLYERCEQLMHRGLARIEQLDNAGC